MKERKFYGPVIILSCLIILFFGNGATATFGVFMQPIVEETGQSVSAISLMASFATGFAFLGNLFVGKALEKLGPKWCFVLGSLIFPVHFLLYSVAHSIVLFYLASSLCGLGLAMCVAPATVLVKNWYVERRATMIGLVISGMGMGGVVMNPMAGYFQKLFGWRAAYQYMALIIAAIIIIFGVFFVKSSPEEIGQKPFGQGSQDGTPKTENAEGADYKTAKKSMSYWLLFAGIMLCGCGVSMFNIYTPSLLTFRGISSTTAANFMGVFTLIGGIGIIVSGWITDKAGTKIFFLYTCLSFIVGCMVLLLGPAQNVAVGIGIVITALSYPLVSNAPANAVMEAYGPKDYDLLIGAITGGMQLGGALIQPIVGSLFDRTGSYLPGYFTAVAAALIGLILVFFAFRISPYHRRAD